MNTIFLMLRDFLRGNWALLLVLGLLAAGWLFLRTPATDLASAEEFDLQIRSGRPVVVEFFSNT